MGRYLSLAWKHSGEVTALTRHAKLCLSSTPTKAGKAHKMCNLSRRARIVLKTSSGIAECERQKNTKRSGPVGKGTMGRSGSTRRRCGAFAVRCPASWKELLATLFLGALKWHVASSSSSILKQTQYSVVQPFRGV